MRPTLTPSASLPDLAVAMFAAASDDRADDTSGVLAALGVLLADPAGLIDWLATFVSPERSRAVAAGSYLHPNRFAKIVLHSAGGIRIRLHVWPAGLDRRGETNPHGHRWDFASTVLCGAGLLETRFGEQPSGTAYVRHTFTGGQDVSALIAGGNVNLGATDVLSVGPHDRYAVATTAVHTIDPIGSSLVATLVVHGPPRVGSTVVYCPAGQLADQAGRPISETEVQDLVRAVISAYTPPSVEEQG